MFYLCAQLLNEMCCISQAAAVLLLKIQCVTVSMEPLLPEGIHAKKSLVSESTRGGAV